jgi:hypothetical protein
LHELPPDSDHLICFIAAIVSTLSINRAQTARTPSAAFAFVRHSDLDFWIL